MSAEYTVTGEDDDIRLDRWFKRHYPGFPHAMLEKHLRKGEIRVDGKKAKSSDRIRQGQVLLCPDMSGAEKPKPKRPVTAEAAAEAQKWVLYKDSNLLVVNKPAGLAVQGGSKVEKSLDDLLDALAFEKDGRPKLVHRLDRDTSGCLVLARSSKDAAQMMKLFSSRRVTKTYLALVNGLPQPLQGTIDIRLAKKSDPKGSGRLGGPEGRDYEVVQPDTDGQIAITHYRVIDHLSTKFSLVELIPETGRMHQLRVHMQAKGCPIVGDHKYGGSMENATSIGVENRLHLHAWRIEIPATASTRKIEAKAPLPPHMQKSFSALGLDKPKK